MGALTCKHGGSMTKDKRDKIRWVHQAVMVGRLHWRCSEAQDAGQDSSSLHQPWRWPGSQGWAEMDSQRNCGIGLCPRGEKEMMAFWEPWMTSPPSLRPWEWLIIQGQRLKNKLIRSLATYVSHPWISQTPGTVAPLVLKSGCMDI